MGFLGARQKMENMKGKSIGALTTMLAMVFLLCCAAFAEVKGDATAPPGSFCVVGVGPGDADLLTARAVSVIGKADLVFCDPEVRERLAELVDLQNKQVSSGYGDLCPFYGKECSTVGGDQRINHEMTCEAYHQKQAEFASMVRKAVKKGQNVVLLSPGDPTLYGQDIWTFTELADLHPRVVAGLSAFNGANAALQAGLGQVIITTPFHGKSAKTKKDGIENLLKYKRATLVIFMPGNMDRLLERLSASCPSDTPMAVVRHAGQRGKTRIVTGTVADMGRKLKGQDTDGSLVYVGRNLKDAPCGKDLPGKDQDRGKFYLVGMGPGDADLATIRALEVIRKADVIFAPKRLRNRFQNELSGKIIKEGYHRLFPFYGKKCSEVTEQERAREKMSCEEYHRKQAELARMVREAVAEGKTVAMLDSGDPLIYGPSSWTLKEFRDIETEVIPGLSCFNAANAALGQGVADKNAFRTVILASGWFVEEMAGLQSTMALFTMRTEFKKFIEALSRHYGPHTPLAIVSRAGYADSEKVERGTLGSFMEEMSKESLPFQYMIYVGDFLDPGARM
ncbi:tetrapyrrole methylase [delta proteobacterium NaphS2]|nr:tetrapyrrole methylase [delta proteobacterium NaphS2]